MAVPLVHEAVVNPNNPAEWVEGSVFYIAHPDGRVRRLGLRYDKPDFQGWAVLEGGTAPLSDRTLIDQGWLPIEEVLRLAKIGERCEQAIGNDLTGITGDELRAYFGLDDLTEIEHEMHVAHAQLLFAEQGRLMDQGRRAEGVRDVVSRVLKRLMSGMDTPDNRRREFRYAGATPELIEWLMEEDEMSYVCPTCGMRSFNPNDIEHKYCGHCHQFESIASAHVQGP